MSRLKQIGKWKQLRVEPSYIEITDVADVKK